MRYLIAMTGSSGAVYGVRLLRALKGERMLIMSRTAKGVIEHELDLKPEQVAVFAETCYEDEDLFAPPSSGSFLYDAMVVIPCSESTLGKIANGIADTLITRAAAVCLKEGRRLVLVPRETPVSAVMLENELKLARLGVTIVPANPGFYSRPESVEDLVDFVVGKVLDQLGQGHDLFRRWGR
ncbi:MAG: UbiX family flavin prenyltransferase [Methanomassiliicoccales archaeon]|nr:UbiX family flavin prenyltransferase [Methanomassiliicoccales archaeon]